MAEATPVTEESTMNRNSSHQLVSDIQVAGIHLKTNDRSTYGEAKSADSALGQEEFPGVRPSSQPVFHSNIADHNGNKLISLVSYLQQHRR